MKYEVRYEVEGFIERETFKTKQQAKKYYNKIMNSLFNYLVSIDLYKIEK